MQERADHIAEWVQITGEKQAQVAPVSDRGPVEGRGNKGGINAAVPDLGIDRTAAQRAVKIASIAPEAKETARAAAEILVTSARVPPRNAAGSLTW